MKRSLLFLLSALVLIITVLSLAAGGLQWLPAWLGLSDPLLVLVFVALSLALTSFIAGVLSGDYSWVDRLWSTAPVVFVWFYAARSPDDVRLFITAIIVTIWGARLTYNFARRGGYTGEEDYRWAILRSRINNTWLWQLFNLTFICLFQIGLFLLFTIPAYLLYLHPSSSVDSLFIVFACLSLCAIIFETIADQQQWDFHKTKTRDVKDGFLSSGLFAYSRHPNYFGELSVWWFLYFAAAASVGQVIGIAILGPVVLTLLFIGSTIFTEGITVSKYPSYRDYQKRVSAIVPWFKFKKHRT